MSITCCDILFGKFRIDQGAIEGLRGKIGLVAGAFGRIMKEIRDGKGVVGRITGGIRDEKGGFGHLTETKWGRDVLFIPLPQASPGYIYVRPRKTRMIGSFMPPKEGFVGANDPIIRCRTRTGVRRKEGGDGRRVGGRQILSRSSIVSTVERKFLLTSI